MTTEEFGKVIRERVDKIWESLGRKGKEYARGDRLSNFKRSAEKLRCTPERALLGMAVKHDTSILDMVEDLESGCSNAPLALWEEKIGDAINYLILLEGLVRERIQAKSRGHSLEDITAAIQKVEKSMGTAVKPVGKQSLRPRSAKGS